MSASGDSGLGIGKHGNVALGITAAIPLPRGMHCDLRRREIKASEGASDGHTTLVFIVVDETADPERVVADLRQLLRTSEFAALVDVALHHPGTPPGVASVLVRPNQR